MEVEGPNKEKVPEYLDRAGRRWHFLCHAKEEEEDLAQFVQQNGLVPGNENGKRRKFGCSRPECHFRAVFLKANSGIYTRGEHWHQQMNIPNEQIICSLSAISRIIRRDRKEVFIGSNGKEFKLVRRFETEDDFEEYRRENWLMNAGGIQMKKPVVDRIYLRCRRSNRNKLSTNCRMSGVFVKRNRSLYMNSEQHNHPMVKEKDDYFTRFLSKYAGDKKADYVDRKGQCWNFLRKIDNFEELQKYAKKQMLYLNNHNRSLFYYKCKYVDKATLTNHPYPPPYCQMRVVFSKVTSSIYVRNEHSHHPTFKMRPYSSHYGKYYNELGKFFETENEEKNKQNDKDEENLPILKQEEDGTDHEEEVRIVKHLQRDYKCLGRMKREGGEEEGQSRTRTNLDCLTVDREEEDLEEGTSSQGTRGRRGRGTFYRYKQRELQEPQPIIKKEEPEEAEEEEGLLQPQQAEMARPAKMLLRERKKRINYGK